jgi:hypothetical protein
VSTWGNVFLGVIALSTLFTAIVQVVLLLAAVKLVRRLGGLVDTVETQVRPLIAQLDSIGRDAARTSSLAVAQVERVDELFGDLVVRVEDTVGAVQSAMTVPMREGSALLAGFRAVFGTLKDGSVRSRSRHRVDDEDALFI